jgi:hypothetical protein
MTHHHGVNKAAQQVLWLLRRLLIQLLLPLLLPVQTACTFNRSN